MGGRIAEDMFVHDISSGAKQDIERATQITRSMVCEWGMSEKLGTVTYDERSDNGQYLGMSGYKEKLYSEKTAQEIDEEVKMLLGEANARAREIIDKNKDVVILMTDRLLEFETLDAEDVRKIVAREWNIEDKRGRMKFAEELHKKTGPQTTPPAPPPLPEKGIEPPPQSPGENFQLSS